MVRLSGKKFNPPALVLLVGALFLTCVLLRGSSLCHAQHGTPSAETLPSPTVGPVTAAEIALWHTQMAESSYSFNQNDKSLSNLVAAYEKLLEIYCFLGFHRTLEYKGEPQDVNCRQYVAKVLAVDAFNPLALCARDGIDSKMCREGFEEIEVNSFQPGVNLWPEDQSGEGIDLETRLDSAYRQEEASALEAEAREREQALRYSVPEKTAELTKKVLEQYVKLLHVSCHITRLKLLRVTEPTPTPGPTSPPSWEEIDLAPPRDNPVSTPAPDSATEKTLDDISAVLSGAKEVGEVTKRSYVREFRRLRYLSPRCFNYIEKALALDARFPAAICYKFGLYSPQCIDSYRQARKKQAAQPQVEGSATPQARKGFKTF